MIQRVTIAPGEPGRTFVVDLRWPPSACWGLFLAEAGSREPLRLDTAAKLSVTRLRVGRFEHVPPSILGGIGAAMFTQYARPNRGWSPSNRETTTIHLELLLREAIATPLSFDVVLHGEPWQTAPFTPRRSFVPPPTENS